MKALVPMKRCFTDAIGFVGHDFVNSSCIASGLWAKMTNHITVETYTRQIPTIGEKFVKLLMANLSYLGQPKSLITGARRVASDNSRNWGLDELYLLHFPERRNQ